MEKREYCAIKCNYIVDQCHCLKKSNDVEIMWCGKYNTLVVVYLCSSKFNICCQIAVNKVKSISKMVN